MEPGGAESKEPLHGWESIVEVRQAPMRVVACPSDAVNAFEEGLGDSEHKRCFPAPHAPATTFSIGDVVEVTSDPTAVTKLGVHELPVARECSDEVEILGIGKCRSCCEPYFSPAENDIVKEIG